ncbi:hypothetical protein DPX16_6609 [Anabarilius grahami]|uniref:Uncharacterized protein n=1 Tax=Anabarilius grahami TaxID=495550 RepID=A0A3N0Z1R5_ANAGA|nr:hypothetical protein DPX16_6609 [Anabarilius grahami]
MDPAVALLSLEQRDRSLESHTLDFLELACLTHYPDRSLCVFYISSLSERSRARLPGSGPQKDFAALVAWVLVSNDSSFTVGPAEDDFATSPTPLPEASQPPSTNVTTEMFHVPTADRGGQPTAMDEPGPRKGSDSTIAPEPTSQQGSDQVSEPVTSPDGEGALVEREGWEESSAHNTTTMETMTDTGKYAEELKEVFMADLIDFFSESLTASSSVPPFLPFSRLTSPTCQMGMSSIFRPSTPSIQEDPLPPLPASTPPAPPRPVDTSASPWLLPPSAPPDTIGHTASPGSLFPAPPWSVVHLPAPTVPSGSSFPPAPPTSSVPPAQPLPSGCPPPPRTLVTMAPPRSPGPSAARGHIGSAVPSGSPAESPLVVPRVSSAPKLTPPWLLPPATLP